MGVAGHVQAVALLAATLDLAGRAPQANSVVTTFLATGSAGTLGRFPWSVPPAVDPIPAIFDVDDGSPSSADGTGSTRGSAPPQRRVAVLDTFAFNGDKVLEVRLALLAPYVDRFYVVEAAVTHAGNRKPVLHTSTDHWRRVFAQYGDKVQVIIIEEFPPVPWVRAWNSAGPPMS